MNDLGKTDIIYKDVTSIDSKPVISDQVSKAVSTEYIPTITDGKTKKVIVEYGGPKGPEPTRYGDWEKGGRVSDF